MIELMIVIAIMGIIMTMSVPAVYRVWHKEALRKAVTDIEEACSHARARAILQGTMTEVVFHAKEGTFEVVGGSAMRGEGSTPVSPTSVASAGSGLSGQLSDQVAVAKLTINGVSYMDAEVARVRFYPNGTCDELRMVLLRPDDRESRGIFLEVTTGLADIETDPNKLAAEIGGR